MNHTRALLLVVASLSLGGCRIEDFLPGLCGSGDCGGGSDAPGNDDPPPPADDGGSDDPMDPPAPVGEPGTVRLINAMPDEEDDLEIRVDGVSLALTSGRPGASERRNVNAGSVLFAVYDEDGNELASANHAVVADHDYSVFIFEDDAARKLFVVDDALDELASPNFRFRFANLIAGNNAPMQVRGALLPSWDYQLLASVDKNTMSGSHLYDATLPSGSEVVQLNTQIDFNNDSIIDAMPGTGFGGSGEGHGLDYVFVAHGAQACLLLIPESGGTGGCLDYDISH